MSAGSLQFICRLGVLLNAAKANVVKSNAVHTQVEVTSAGEVVRSNSYPTVTIENAAKAHKTMARGFDSFRDGEIRSDAAYSSHVAIQTKAQAQPTEPPPFYSTMKNEGNGSFYTVVLCFGNPFPGEQDMCLPGIPDTGSFELVVRSSRCRKCHAPFYNDSNSSTFDAHVTKHNRTQLMYGSGPVQALWVYDDVKVQGALDPSASVWSHLWTTWSMGGNNTRMQVSHQRFLESLGTPISDFAKGTKMCGIYGIGRGVMEGRQERFIARAGVKRYSICLPRDDHKNGTLVWSSEDVSQNENYTAINVKGKYHWAVETSKFRLGHSNHSHENWMQDIFKKAGIDHLQDSTACAILDSGTTLIAPTTQMAAKMSAYLAANPLNCHDISSMPTLQFKLDGHDFVLPPEAYVAKFDSDNHNKTDLMNKLFHVGDTCFLLFTSPMDLEQPNPSCPVMILGMPFFRFYKTTFDWYAEPTKGHKTNNTGMVYVTEHSDCVDSKNSWNETAQNYYAGTGNMASHGNGKKLMKINPSHLKFPKPPAHYFQHGTL